LRASSGEPEAGPGSGKGLLNKRAETAQLTGDSTEITPEIPVAVGEARW
jgi:hypothetical protein